MDVGFGWIFVSTLLSKVIQIETSLEIKVGHVRVLRKLPQLQQCAVKALQKDVYVGGRISDETDACEGLPHSWGRNKTIKSGYGYVKNDHVRLNFEPPLEVQWKTWGIPVILSTGAKIDIHLMWKEIVYTTLYIVLQEALQPQTGRWINIIFYPRSSVIYEYSKTIQLEESVSRQNTTQPFRTSKRWKISFVAEGNTLCILANDEIVMKKKLFTVRLNYVRWVTVETLEDSSVPKPRIHSFEFTEA